MHVSRGYAKASLKRVVAGSFRFPVLKSVGVIEHRYKFPPAFYRWAGSIWVRRFYVMIYELVNDCIESETERGIERTTLKELSRYLHEFADYCQQNPITVRNRLWSHLNYLLYDLHN